MKEIKVFIAGSKSLTIERDAIRSVLQILSNKNAKNVLTRTYTYEEFDTSLSPEGRQKEYNSFIMNEADYVIFVLDGTIGGITLEEFNVAWNTFMAKKRLGIYVYHKPTATISKEIQEVIDKINHCRQYYTEYSDIENLKLKIENSFHSVVYEKSIKLTPKTPGHLRLRKILLSVFLSLISVILVLGTSYSIACKTLRYEYDYSEKTATVVAKKTFFRCKGYVNIPERVKHEGQYFEVRCIGEGAFINYSKMTSVTIPNGVIDIQNKAFAGCSNLTSITIPNSVTTIGEEAFYGCHGLKSITIGNNVKTIDNNAFRSCTALSDITIPNSVTTIGENAFYRCSNLRRVIIGNNVDIIGKRAFYHCNLLREVIIPNSVITIGEEAFYDCFGLRSITIGNNVKTIGNRAFRGCTALRDITIPNSVTTIGYAAFMHCLNIQSLTIGNAVTCIKSSAFENCDKLLTITIPKSVTEIGKNTFPEHTKIIRE